VISKTWFLISQGSVQWLKLFWHFWTFCLFDYLTSFLAVLKLRKQNFGTRTRSKCPRTPSNSFWRPRYDRRNMPDKSKLSWHFVNCSPGLQEGPPRRQVVGSGEKVRKIMKNHEKVQKNIYFLFLKIFFVGGFYITPGCLGSPETIRNKFFPGAHCPVTASQVRQKCPELCIFSWFFSLFHQIRPPAGGVGPPGLQ